MVRSPSQQSSFKVNYFKFSVENVISHLLRYYISGKLDLVTVKKTKTVYLGVA